jgi:hypothetical protein
MDKPKQPPKIPPDATPEQIQEIMRQHQADWEDFSASQKKGTRWQYFWLWLMLGMFLVWMGSFLFTFVSHLTFSGEEGWKTPNVVPLVFFIIMISVDWKAILAREPPTDELFRRKHRRILLITVVLFGALAVVAVFGGIWNGHNREKVHKIEALVAEAVSAGEIGTKVSTIKNRQLKTTADYLEAYNEIDRLLPGWKKKVQSVSSALAEVRGYDLDARTSSMLAVYSAALDMGREGIVLTEREVAVVRQMSSLPRDKQIAFWNESFKPLQYEESALSIKADAIRKQASSLSNGGPLPQQ